MRWKIETPELRTTRTRRAFAWFPVTTEDGYRLWLESYLVCEVYLETRTGENRWCFSEAWTLL